MPSGNWNRRAFTMLEIVVGIFLLTIGALGYAALTASLARSFLNDARRLRAGELATAQVETLLRQGCAGATSGMALRFGMPVEWSVTAAGPTQKKVVVVVTREGISGPRRDSLSALVPCT
jgi:hypothetical protein